MLKTKIVELLDKYTEEVNVKALIEKVLEYEQKYISYELKPNDSRLKEILEKIREEVEALSKSQ